jgi:uncharacterized protein (TIGR02217 family)
MEFREIRLDMGYDYGAEGGPEFSTDVVGLAGGYESRNQNWVQVRGSWALGERNVLNTENETLQNFHHEMRGRLHTFRWRDWADFRVVDEPLVTAENDTTIQLIKTYGAGVDPYVRTVQKPSALTQGGDAGYLFDPITLKRNGVFETGWTLDITTGVITLDVGSPVVLNDVFTWSGEFDKPVRFDSDRYLSAFGGYRDSDHTAVFYLSALNVVEVKL